MFQTHLLKDADQNPTLKLTLDMHVTEEDREIAIIGYKQTNIDWTRPFEVQLKGMLKTKTCMYPHLRLPYSVALGKALELLYHKLAPPPLHAEQNMYICTVWYIYYT